MRLQQSTWGSSGRAGSCPGARMLVVPYLIHLHQELQESETCQAHFQLLVPKAQGTMQHSEHQLQGCDTSPDPGWVEELGSPGLWGGRNDGEHLQTQCCVPTVGRGGRNGEKPPAAPSPLGPITSMQSSSQPPRELIRHSLCLQLQGGRESNSVSEGVGGNAEKPS